MQEDFVPDVQVVGVVSGLKPYKLAWELNRLLEIVLIRQQDVQVLLDAEQLLPIVHFTANFSHSFLRLVRNRSYATTPAAKPFFLPELSDFDFLLLLEEPSNEQVTELLTALQAIKEVAYAKEIPLKAIKSLENLLF